MEYAAKFQLDSFKTVEALEFLIFRNAQKVKVKKYEGYFFFQGPIDREIRTTVRIR